MQKFSFVVKLASLFAFILLAQNSLAQGPQKTKPNQTKTAPAVSAQNPAPTQVQSPAQPAIAPQPDFSLDEHKQEIERIKNQHQRIADKIRSLTPEQRQIVKDEIRRHRETMKDLLGDAWQDLEQNDQMVMPQDFNAPNSAPSQNSAPNQNIPPMAPNAAPAPNQGIPPMPPIAPNGKSPNQLPKPPVAVQR